MMHFAARPLTIPIPFERLLNKVVAIVDREDAQARQLLEHLEAGRFEVEVADRHERDVSEDADVGAYIALIDGDRRERARIFQERVEGRIEFHTYVVRE